MYLVVKNGKISEKTINKTIRFSKKNFKFFKSKVCNLIDQFIKKISHLKWNLFFLLSVWTENSWKIPGFYTPSLTLGIQCVPFLWIVLILFICSCVWYSLHPRYWAKEAFSAGWFVQSLNGWSGTGCRPISE